MSDLDEFAGENRPTVVSDQPVESEWMKQARIVDRLQVQYDTALEGIRTRERQISELRAESDKLAPLIEQARSRLGQLQRRV